MSKIIPQINRAVESWVELCTRGRGREGLDEEHYRQRILVITSLSWLLIVVGLIIVTPLLINLTPEGTFAATLLFVATGLSVLISMLVLRHLDNRIIALHLLLLAYTAAFAIACVYFGGTRSPTYALLIMAPVMSAIAGSPRATLFWSAIITMIWLTVLGLERIGVQFEQVIAPQNYNVAITIAYAGMGLGVTSILVVYAEMNKRLRDTLSETNQELAFLSSHDDLTGLYNRRFYGQRMSGALERAIEFNQPLGLLVFDLNHFKIINDTYGHGAGDKLLTELGKRLQNQIRETDLIARLGGDEFAVILENVHSLDDMEMIARKVVAAIEQPYTLRNRPLALKASCGLAMFPEHGRSQAQLEEHADRAMYRAKQSSVSVEVAEPV